MSDERTHPLVDVIVAFRIGAVEVIINNDSSVLKNKVSEAFKWYREMVSIAEGFDKIVNKLQEQGEQGKGFDAKINKLLEAEVKVPALGPFKVEDLFPEGQSHVTIKQVEALMNLGVVEDLLDRGTEVETHFWDIVNAKE